MHDGGMFLGAFGMHSSMREIKHGAPVVILAQERADALLTDNAPPSNNACHAGLEEPAPGFDPGASTLAHHHGSRVKPGMTASKKDIS
jgi:hypothetical protein